MRRERPVLVTVVAILNFIFGGLGLVTYFCSGLSVVALLGMANMVPPGQGGVNPMQEMMNVMQAIPGYIPYMVISITLNILLTIVLIASGFGLLQLRPWGRWASVVAAFGLFLSSVAGVVYTLVFVNPAMMKWAEDFNRKMGAATPPQNPMVQNALAMIVPLFLIAYAVTLVVILFLPNVSAAFRSNGGASPDDADDRPRRRGRFEDE